MPHLNLLINTKAELTTEILIYIADMIKQSFAKILKVFFNLFLESKGNFKKLRALVFQAV
jgi:hypothetical protein